MQLGIGELKAERRGLATQLTLPLLCNGKSKMMPEAPQATGLRGERDLFPLGSPSAFACMPEIKPASASCRARRAPASAAWEATLVACDGVALHHC